MYLPPYNEEQDLRVLHTLVQQYPFGAWVSTGEGGLTANHIPFVLDASRGRYGTLRAHVSRNNPVCKELSVATPSLVMFQGPHAYITPSWYPSKEVDGRVVPTWNYVVVHAHGTPSVIHDKEWILQTITDLTQQSESPRAAPWRVSDAPVEFIDRMLNAIVGIEIPIDKIVGRWKLSQDETLADRVGVVAGLLALKDPNSVALSDLVKTRLPKTAS